MESSRRPAASGRLADTGDHLRRSTVHVRSSRMGSGSGVIWQSDGLIVTNAHVAPVPSATVELWDGREFEAERVLIDQQRDLAALTIHASDLPAVEIGDSDQLRVGQLVVAVGNPLGLSGALTAGIIHAIGPTQVSDRQTWVQADVRLAPGNSGGPLADVLGRVVGVNSMVAGGLGLAVPSTAVTRFLAGHGARPRLGITTQPVLTSAPDRIGGLLVLAAEPNEPAALAGVMLGDILVAANGLAITTADELGFLLHDVGAAATMELKVLRAGLPITLTLTLAPAGEVKGRTDRLWPAA